MDDMKLFARGKKQLEGELELVRRFSEDIGMKFGLEKCALVEVKRGKFIETDDIKVSEGQVIQSMKIGEMYK